MTLLCHHDCQSTEFNQAENARSPVDIPQTRQTPVKIRTVPVSKIAIFR